MPYCFARHLATFGLVFLLVSGAWAPAAEAQGDGEAERDPQGRIIPESVRRVAPVLPSGPETPSGEIRRVVERLEGSWRSEGETLRIRSVELAATGETLYVERVSSGRELEPTFQEVWAIYETSEGASIRIMTAPTRSLLNNRLLGSWAEPRLFPRLFPDQLEQVGDMSIGLGEGGPLRLRVTSPLTVLRAGAYSVERSIVVDGEGEGLSWVETGLDADGAPVWGETPTAFERWDEPERYRVTPDGVQVITLAASDEEPALEIGDTAAAYFRALLGDGRVLADQTSTLQAPRTLQTPVQFSEGLNRGLEGVRGNEVVRVIVPPTLTEREVQSRLAPPNVPVIYDVRVAAVRDQTRGENPPPPPPGR